jgi:hypothetical protein
MPISHAFKIRYGPLNRANRIGYTPDEGDKRMLPILLVALLAGQTGSGVFPAEPRDGTRHYLYRATEMAGAHQSGGYRTEFDLETSGGATYAVIRKSSVFDGAWKPVEPDAKCRAAMHGDKSSLARVKLSPMDPEAAKTLGESFLPMCAPPGVFFPLTDILNVAIIPTSDRFRASELRKTGDSLAYPGFDAAFDRSGIAMRETSPGGEIKLSMLDKHRAVLDWQPAIADLELIEQAHQPPVHLKGTEHFAFRVEVDRKTGFIERAAATYDNLNLKVIGAPDSLPPLQITRTVTIDPL